jgi:ABC-type antimicrobial peptide transport system permease subunit
MILKNLWRRKTRTFLTILGITVGVAAVVALSAFGEGLAGGFEKMFGSYNADLTVGQKEAMLLLMSSVDEQIGIEIKQIDGVAEVNGTVVSVMNLPDLPYFVILGEDPNGFIIHHYQIITGAPLSGRKQILLGQTTAKNLSKSVGGVFRLNDADSV